MEFCLHDCKTGEAVDCSNFCSSTTLNQQEAFISDLYKQLKAQQIAIECLHSESGTYDKLRYIIFMYKHFIELSLTYKVILDCLSNAMKLYLPLFFFFSKAHGQLEVVLRYQTDAVLIADSVVLLQETIRAVSRKYGLKALFLPKIKPTAAGNGLHLHLSFNDLVSGHNAISSVGSLSSRGQAFLEGILVHLPGLLGLTMPINNSYRRVGEGCWTGSRVTWALEDKEAPLRVCSSLYNEEWQHVEFKLCDCYSNIYLSLATILMSGLDGISKELSLRPQRHDKEGDIVPDSLEKSLDCLQQDEMLMQLLGPISKSYLCLRRSEAIRAANMTLEDEVQIALDKA